MSVNHLMHPRNIYKKPPNFVELALNDPEFRKFIKQDLSGKVSVNFKQRDAVLALTKALLQKDFDLKLELPGDRLVPTLPLRLNYILWLEDILQLKQLAKEEPVRGIDIGAACIYPLLAAKKNGWQLLATEVDSASVECANSNVASNKLSDLIKVRQVTSDNVLLDVVDDQDGDFSFCMCNPPFFSNEDQLHCAPERQPPRNAPSGRNNELIAPGGEVAFVKRIMDDSFELGFRIRVYTTMLGRKSSLKPLKTYLQEKKWGMTLTIGSTEFCQGHTTRWGLAWSFLPGLLLQDAVKLKKKTEKKKNPAVINLTDWTLENALFKLTLLLKELEFRTRLIKKTEKSVQMHIIADRNTWTHQRRKRRAEKRLMSTPFAIEGNSGVRVNGKDNDSSSYKKSRLENDSEGLLQTDGTNNLEEGHVSKTAVIEEKNSCPFPKDEIGCSIFKDENSCYVSKDKVEPVCGTKGDSTPEGHILPESRLHTNGSSDDKNECSFPKSPDIDESKLKDETNFSAKQNGEGESGDFIENNWSEVSSLPLVSADILVEKSELGVMIAISLADGCTGGWELIQQIRQTILNKITTK